MLVAILIVLNIPVYLLFGWVVFDTKSNAADTLFDTVVAVVKIIVIPKIVRELAGMDTEGSWGLLPIAGFLAACAGIVYGEYYLLGKFFGLA